MLPAPDGSKERGVYDMRRKKEAQSHDLKRERRPVCCPVCGWRILDVAIDTKMRLITPTKSQNPDFSIKCGHCGSEIGVIKTE